jgi:hypothetical protein
VTCTCPLGLGPHLGTCPAHPYNIRKANEAAAKEPVCDFCGDTGHEPVWLMTWHGEEEATQKCKHCNAKPREED